MIRLLRRNRDFRLLFTAQVVSYAGDWFTSVALIGLVLDLTGSDLMAALVFVAQFLPGFVLSPLTGPAADRFDRRRLMVAISAVQCAAALLLLAVGPSRVWLAFVAVSAISGAAAFFSPASQAAMPNVVDAEDLPVAVTMLSSTWGAMLAVGAGLGGLFAVAFGRQAAFVADAVTFAVAGALISRVRRPMSEGDGRGGERVRPLRDTREALSFARRTPAVLALLGSKMGFGTANGLVGLLPLFATRRFGAGDAGIGVLLAARGVGVVIGPLMARRFTTPNVGRILTACGVASISYAACYALLPAAPGVWFAAAVVCAAHLGGGAQWTLSTYGLQTQTPDRLRGRIFAADYALVTMTMSVSFLAAGAASSRVGPAPVALALAAIGAAWGVVYLVLTRNVRRARAPAL